MAKTAEVRVKFETVMMDPLDLVTYEKNNKDHPEEQLKELMKSIQEFGVVVPLIAESNKTLIAGHGTREACIRLGLKEVPVIVRDDLTVNQARVLRIKHNRISEFGKTNRKNLIWEIFDMQDKELALMYPEIDIFKDLDPDKETIEDDAPGVKKEYTVKQGDIFQLGVHTLMCGNSGDKEMVDKLMGGKRAEMIFTDPPYNVDYKGSQHKAWDGIKNDSMSDAEFEAMLTQWFARYRENILGGGAMYVFHSTSTQALFEKHIRDAGFDVKCQLVWNKPSAAMGWSDYRWKHEPFFYCTVKGESVNFYGDRTHTTMIDLEWTDQKILAALKHTREAEKEGKTTVWTMKRDHVKDYVHPTQKPVELIGYAMANSSRVGETVLDLFGGSGSTLIACEKHKRVCHSMELDERYVEVIIKRFYQYTGGKETIRCVNRSIDLDTIIA